MNPLIALQYETPDFAGAIHRGQQMYAQRQEAERANELAAYMQANGAGIMSGDQNALAGLAAYDPQVAMRIQESHTGMANDAARLRMAERETNSSISDRAARLEILRGDAEQQAAEHSAKMDAAQRAQTVETLTTILPAFQGVQDAETWDRMAGELAPDAVGKFDQRDELFAMGEGMLRGFGGRPEPLSPEGKLAADREAGYDVGANTLKPTGDMLEYDFARSQGYEGTFQDYQTEMKRAGATSVTVGGDGAANLPKPSTGFVNVPNPDGSYSQAPVAGGSGEQISADVAGRLALAEDSLLQLPGLIEQARNGDLTGAWDWMTGRVGRGAQGAARRDNMAASESITRMLTGAGMNQSEAEREADLYIVGVRDNAATAASKLTQLQRRLAGLVETARRGRTGVNVDPVTGFGIPTTPATPQAVPEVPADVLKQLQGAPAGTRLQGPNGEILIWDGQGLQAQ